ncbi:MAG: SLOG family protein [Clostridia bacterium]|nr:SLOG family protein [Clostridia bacterium]
MCYNHIDKGKDRGKPLPRAFCDASVYANAVGNSNKAVIMEKICGMTGMRLHKLGVKNNEKHPQIIKLKHDINCVLEELLRRGYMHFLNGMALGSDTFMLEALLLYKKRYPDIFIEAVIPCLDQACKWSNADRERYERNKLQCDLVGIYAPRFDDDCMKKRNEEIVKRCDLLVACWDGVTSGGTQQTVNLAIVRNKPIILINPSSYAIEQDKTDLFFNANR